MGIIGAIVSWFVGGGASGMLGQLRQAYEMKLNAENSEQRMAADLDIARIEASARIAELANADRWSATSIGRYLIVVPFGVWWTAIFIDSTFTMEWDVLALPMNIMAMAEWLVPVIVAGDVGKYIFRPRR